MSSRRCGVGRGGGLWVVAERCESVVGGGCACYCGLGGGEGLNVVECSSVVMGHGACGLLGGEVKQSAFVNEVWLSPPRLLLSYNLVQSMLLSHYHTAIRTLAYYLTLPSASDCSSSRIRLRT
jgi:hypothetical protein